MPPGGRLFVFTPDYQEILGPFTDADNRSHGELWIPRLPGEEIVVEISVPADAVADLQVEIGAVERGFLDRQSDAWRSCQPAYGERRWLHEGDCCGREDYS